MHLVLCNCAPADAPGIARSLVEERLAACVNILPGVTSVYVWEGAVQEETEATLLIKVSAARRDALTARLAELHPYDVPEILVLDPDVAASSQAYVAWVRST